MKLEYCCQCAEATGRAGAGDDSLYTETDGPFCEGCFPSEQPEQEMSLQEQLDDALQSAAFYRRRVEALQNWQSKMRDPERTIVCDIIANGCTLDSSHAGDRYTSPPQRHLESTTDMMMKLADRLGELPDDVDPRAWSHLLVYAPQRQPLTNDEIDDIWAGCSDPSQDCIDMHEFARAVEAKLKEKNT